MQFFIFNDAIRFKLATQQEDTQAKTQVFIGVLVGVLLRWIYSVAVDVVKNNAPWCFGTWLNILIRIGIALVTTFFLRLLAKGQRPTGKHAILECSGLWDFD